MKELSVWLVVLVMIVFATRYSYQIWRAQIKPTLSTWIIFLSGTGLSLITYAIAENHDFKSGILNTMDVVAVAIVLVVILIWGNREIRFKSFEKKYLSGVGIIILYGLLSGDAWGSNIFTQVLISIGYFPTMQNLITVKRNVESFTGWSCDVVAGTISLYPALDQGNDLSVIYAIRTIVLVSIILGLMIHYQLRQKD